ncbi:MAG: glycosyltransferase family 2 protein, partial [FCB group bacterium]|nr:glycosyltransferase family 2 protein [FCB group bacterium]
MPKVSIIIPCYNYAEFLEPALSSILCQSYPDWEVIVVDDGSADNSAETAETFFSKFPDRKWKLIRQENAGLPSARNAGIRESSGEFILPLDADDMLHPLYLERTVPVLIKTPGLGYVYVIADCFGDEHRTWTGGEFDFGKLLENNLMTCTTLYRKQAWLDAGGYNPNMKHGFEDWDLWVGMAEKGWFGRLLNEPLFLYRKHGSTMLTETYA